jgi:hypothetical protein
VPDASVDARHHGDGLLHLILELVLLLHVPEVLDVALQLVTPLRPSLLGQDQDLLGEADGVLQRWGQAVPEDVDAVEGGGDAHDGDAAHKHEDIEDHLPKAVQLADVIRHQRPARHGRHAGEPGVDEGDAVVEVDERAADEGAQNEVQQVHTEVGPELVRRRVKQV